MRVATLISGPMASGKSMLADALRVRLEHRGIPCIHVELDAQRLLDLNGLDVMGKRELLKREIEEKDAELILVAVDPDMQKAKALCHDLGIPLARHVITDTFNGWMGYGLGEQGRESR